jgi:hypothetical protein
MTRRVIFSSKNNSGAGSMYPGYSHSRAVLFYCFLSIVAAAVTGCGTTPQRLTITDEEAAMRLAFKISGVHRFQRSSMEKRLQSALRRIVSALPDESMKKQVFVDQMKLINVLPENTEQTFRIGADGLNLKVLNRVLRDVMAPATGQVMLHTNRWTHQGIVPNANMSGKFTDAGNGTFRLNVSFQKIWRWGGPSKLWSRADVKVEAILNRVESVDPDYLIYALHIESVDIEQPTVMFGVKQVADVSFDAESFKLLLAMLPNHYRDTLAPRGDHPDTAYINDIIQDSKKLVGELLQGMRSRERARKLSLTKQFRTNLVAGVKSHCGLVVEVKPPIAAVQTDQGLHWFRVEQLYPVGIEATCRFFNGQYVEQYL